MYNGKVFLKAYEDVYLRGTKVNPRGLECREQLNYTLVLDAKNPLTSFKGRKYSLDYAKREMLWMLTGNRYNSAITEFAAMWRNVMAPDEGWNSQYGQYWFGPQAGYKWVVDELKRDSHSRRAVIPMNQPWQLDVDNNDHVCTMNIQFMIRDNQLHMFISMRSCDIVFGLSTDLMTFYLLYNIVYGLLLRSYPQLEFGQIYHTSQSLHVYERHYQMVEQILADGIDGYEKVELPQIESAYESERLIEMAGLSMKIWPENCKFIRWLYGDNLSSPFELCTMYPKEYKAWQGIKWRTDPKLSNLPKYIALGMSKAFKDSFQAFLLDIGPAPDDSLTIDRIDNLKGYIEGNLRWATKSEQTNNRDNTIRAWKDGTFVPLTLCFRADGIDPYSRQGQRICDRVKDGHSYDKAKQLAENRRGGDIYSFRGEELSLRQISERVNVGYKFLYSAVWRKKDWESDEQALERVIRRLSNE